MSEFEPSRVIMFDNSHLEMQRAYENALATLRCFWREVAGERRRIVPAPDLEWVKAPFAGCDEGGHAGDTPEVERMRLSEVD